MKPIKTVLTLMLVLVMVLSLVACGSANTEQLNEQSTQGQGVEIQKPQDSQSTETPTESVEETPENTEEPATSEPVEEPTETPKDEPLFDTSWAQNDFERMIPQPPFSGWQEG